MKRPLILVTNDDGITAPGIRALIDMTKEFGDIYVVAPDSPQSGMGHAVTIHSIIQTEEVLIEDDTRKEFSCSGTPVDCVKLAVSNILPRRPDLCVSGINHGSNSSINVIYSGTMSAAVEAGIEGIPAIGFSLQDFSYNADFEAAREYIQKIIKQVLNNGLPKGVVLNVNIPKLPKEELKGIKVCRQADAKWIEEFDKREDPRGRTYYWMTGEFKNLDKGEDTDEFALSQGYISVVPVRYDLTAHHVLMELKNWDL
ncbi:5'/3'-nucleotidase SurE [Weeksella virosa]|uniref:5'-nucleotidase SurE n=1 Tax=Weeksella virosa (strain ATCC 43766 / DSM 16922 / JCM 21250 / CCUG 30538 / CDC 9751 / IAM 14551 / NBRC 16016 / NCTC 11634 / CL345/78) TaxID=865938 RepID=F0NXY4_WEEVC|nr:5'/3'-nucleotidase SurE [Weeksella virosa]ADX68052.1 Multifunctional protein surE [Weeksella virosa DSM 16922]MDK7675391.1 5'/3'-nucleotidase SurE [Weeksella virosa]SUP54361.1 5'-nucleotidase surE [Weeksella virosa]VEH64314.1 5'-nucleotidase surE [Weeksella virosa]